MQTVTIATGGTTSTAASFYQSSLAAIEVRTRNGVAKIAAHGSMDGTTFNPIVAAGTAVVLSLVADNQIHVVDPDLYRAFTKVKFVVTEGTVGPGGMSINVLGERFTSRLRPTE